MGRIFIAGGKSFLLDDIEWSGKPGNCDQRLCKNDWEDCEFAVKENGKRKCCKTLIAHCCKHVVKGSGEEQERFSNVAREEFGEIENFPKIISADKKIIDIYEGVSKRVLKTANHVGISATDKGINYFCSGTGKYHEFTDYISLEESNTNELKSVMISMYLKDVDMNSYYLLHCLYERDWILNMLPIGGGVMLPVMSENEDDIDICVAEALARGCEFFPAGAERNDVQYGALMYFYSFQSEKILSFYEAVYSKTRMCSSVHYEENEDEISKILKDFMIRDNRTYRNRVISFYLNEIKPLDWNLFTRYEKEKAMINYKTYLEDYVECENNDESEEKLELIFIKKYLAVEKYNCTKHIANGWDRIINDLELFEEDEKTMFNILDFSVFYIVSSYTYFFIALYVIWIMQYKGTEKKISQDFIDDLNEWKKGFDRIVNMDEKKEDYMSPVKKKLVEWQTKIDRLYRLEEPRNELLKLLLQ